MKKRTAVILVLAVVLAGTGAVIARKQCSTDTNTEAVYKETTADYGTLTVGITESGNVEVGTTTQEFLLDISEYSGSQDTQTDVFSWSGGMPGMSQSVSRTDGSSAARSLTVEEVYVSVGEEVEAGEPLYRLSKESIEKIRKELSEDKEEAALDLKKAETKLRQTTLSAAHDYETDQTYGAAAELAYTETLTELTQTRDLAAEKLAVAEEELAVLREEESALAEKGKESSHLYDEAEYLVSYIDREDDPYGYINAVNLREQAQTTKKEDEDALSDKQDEIVEKQEEIVSLQRELNKAEKEKKSGEITAKADYDTRIYRLNNAAELYQVSVGIKEQDVEAAADAYDEAKGKLDEFDATIQDGNVISEYSGVITELGLSVGDALSQGSSILTLKDYGEASVTVTVEDGDIDNIAVGDSVNVFLSAFPEKQFTGTVSEIGDAKVDTYSATITYEVTVDIEGDVNGIYSGMTGEVTFITKETKEVTYVLNRAIHRDGVRSFVYIRNADGNIVEKDVVTGFSDGINVEITEGLTKGDTVLIESKVSEE